MEVRNGFKVATNYISSALSIDDGLMKGDVLYTSGLFNCICIVAYTARNAYLCHLNTASVTSYAQACRVRLWLQTQTGATAYMHSLGKVYMRGRGTKFTDELAKTYALAFGAAHGLPGPSAQLDWDERQGVLRLMPSDDDATITDNGYGRAMPTDWGPSGTNEDEPESERCLIM